MGFGRISNQKKLSFYNQLSSSTVKESYDNAINMISEAIHKKKILWIKDNGEVSYAGFFRKLWEEIRGFCGLTNHTDANYTTKRVVHMIDLGVDKDWLSLEKIKRIEDSFFEPLRKEGHVSKNVDVRNSLDLMTIKNKLSQKHVPQAHQTQVQKGIIIFANNLCNRISASHSSGKSFSISPVSMITALGMCLHVIRKEKQQLFLEKLGYKD